MARRFRRPPWLAAGTDHWYQLDGYFNGGTAPWLAAAPPPPAGASDGAHGHGQGGLGSPPGPDPDPASWHRRGLAAYQGLNRTDPEAVWSYQGWAFLG